jgi:hypothetical protein
MPNLILNLARAVLLCLQAALRRRRHHSTRSVSYCTGLSLRQPPSGAPQNVTWESEITYTRASRLPPTRRHLTRQNTARGGSSRHRRASTGAREESYCTGRWPPPNPGRLCLPATTSQPPPAPPGRGPCCLPAASSFAPGTILGSRLPAIIRHLEAHDADLTAHSSGIQVALCTNSANWPRRSR